MRFYDRYSQLVLKGDTPFYSDVKHIHSNPDYSKTGVIYESIRGRNVKTTVSLASNSNVWIVPQITTITQASQ